MYQPLNFRDRFGYLTAEEAQKLNEAAKRTMEMDG